MPFGKQLGTPSTLTKPPVGMGAFIGSAAPVLKMDGATYLRSGVIAVRAAYPNVPPDIYSSGILNLPPSSTYTTGQHYSGAYGNGTYVLLNCAGSTGNVEMSVDGGVTWTSRALPSTVATWQATQPSIAFGAGLFVVIAGAGAGNTTAWTSPDAITWTLRTLPSSTYGGVFYVGGIFVACGAGIVATSTDGLTWTSRTCASSSMANNSIVLFATVNGVGTHFTMSTLPAASSSVDGGVTWSTRSAPPVAMQAVPGSAFVDQTGKVIAYYSSGTAYQRSFDGGETWVAGTATGDTLYSYQLTWLDGYLYGAAQGGTSQICRSVDGCVWQRIPLNFVPSGTGTLIAGPHRLIVGGSVKSTILTTDVVGIDTYTPNLYLRVE